MQVSLPMAPIRAEGLSDFDRLLQQSAQYPLAATDVTTLQVNVGKRCNQACGHCHVEAGPSRTEEMTRETAALVIEALRRHPGITTLDITGGAPELNPSFEFLVVEARRLGRHVLDRCNLTILFVPGQERLAQFLADQGVEVVASLPYYLADRTDAQRGQGVFEQSITALRLLNSLGYGQPDTGLTLNLVYNPTGAFLPPAQAAIEAEYKRELEKRHGIVFNHLFTITNMPIARFRHFLERSGNYDKYLSRLRRPPVRLRLQPDARLARQRVRPPPHWGLRRISPSPAPNRHGKPLPGLHGRRRLLLRRRRRLLETVGRRRRARWVKGRDGLKGAMNRAPTALSDARAPPGSQC